MTTKRVVADDVLGQLARKQAELTRRVMEGTLNPERVLEALQQLIEGKSVAAFEVIETWPMTVSGRTYEVEYDNDTLQTIIDGLADRIEMDSYRQKQLPTFQPVGGPPAKTGKSKLTLVRFDQPCSIKPAIQYLHNAGYEPANAWEFLAFVEQSGATQLVHEDSDGLRLFCLGTKAPSKEGRNRHDYMGVISSVSKRKWTLYFWDDLDQGSFHGQIWKGNYVVVRAK